MLEIMSLLYELYNYYLFMAVFFVCAAIAYDKKKQTYVQSVAEKSVLGFFVFLMGMGVSLLIKWLPGEALREPIRGVAGLCASGLFGWNSSKIINWMIVTTKKICLKEHVRQWGYGIAIFILWMIQLILQLPEEITRWVECWYAVDYSMGLGSRFLIGGILSLFYNEYMDRRIAYTFCMIMMVLLVALCSFMLGKLLNKTKYKVAVLFLIACLWACPASLASYWNVKNFGRLEVYTLLISLACVCLFLGLKKIWLKYSILCLGTIICNAIYQGYVFLYFPLLFIVVVCEAYKNEFKKSDLLGGFMVLASACGSFLFFQFGTSIVFDTQAEFEAAIAAKSDVYISSGAIMCEMFMDIPQVFEMLIVPFLTEDDFPREILAFTIVVFAPIIITGIALYLKCFDLFKVKDKILFKNPYFWCIICQFAILPQFLLNIDWGRWLVAIITVFFFGIFYMLYMEMEEMNCAIAALNSFVKKHYVIALMIIMYFTMFAKFTEHGMKSQVYMFVENVMKLLGTLL